MAESELRKVADDLVRLVKDNAAGRLMTGELVVIKLAMGQKLLVTAKLGNRKRPIPLEDKLTKGDWGKLRALTGPDWLVKLVKFMHRNRNRPVTWQAMVDAMDGQFGGYRDEGGVLRVNEPFRILQLGYRMRGTEHMSPHRRHRVRTFRLYRTL